VAENSEGFSSSLEARASQHATSVKQSLKVDYDFTPESLQRVDQALAHFHPDGFSFDLMLHNYSAYVGETIRRNHGGEWIKEDDGTGASVRGIEGKATIYPFVWMAARMESLSSGENAKEINSQYASMLESMDMLDKLPAPIPADYIHTLAEPEIWGGSKTTESDANKKQQGEGTSEFTAKEKQEAILKAPASCFVLVAGCDGNIDKKEAKAFMKDLQKQMASPNKLISSIFTVAATQLESDLESIAQEGSAMAITIPLTLMKARVAAEEMNADMAGEFCQVLYDMSVQKDCLRFRWLAGFRKQNRQRRSCSSADNRDDASRRQE